MKPQVPKKIRSEDFPQEYQELVSQLGFIYNDNADITYQIIAGGIDFDNLNRQYSVITVTIDPSGGISNPPQIKTALKTKVKGINVISAVNVNNTMVYPTAAPFVSYTTNANLLTILNVSGLPVSSQWQLSLEIIG